MILLFMNPWMNANDLGALRHTVTKCSSCKWSSFWGDSVAAGSPPSRCSALLNNCRNDLHHIQVPFLHVTPDRRLRSFCLRLCLPSSRPWSITGGRRPNFGRAAASPLTWFGTTSQKHLTWFRGLRRRRGSVPVLNQIVSSRRRSALAGSWSITAAGGPIRAGISLHVQIYCSMHSHHCLQTRRCVFHLTVKQIWKKGRHMWNL